VSTTTIQGKRRTTPDLFGNDEDPKAKDDDADLQDDFGMVDDDWIIDDIGGGMLDDPPERERVGKSGKDGFVKEMGRCIFCSL
jgi:chromosome transmission fidelity protein 4